MANIIPHSQDAANMPSQPLLARLRAISGDNDSPISQAQELEYERKLRKEAERRIQQLEEENRITRVELVRVERWKTLHSNHIKSQFDRIWKAETECFNERTKRRELETQQQHLEEKIRESRIKFAELDVSHVPCFKARLKMEAAASAEREAKDREIMNLREMIRILETKNNKLKTRRKNLRRKNVWHGRVRVMSSRRRKVNWRRAISSPKQDRHPNTLLEEFGTEMDRLGISTLYPESFANIQF